MLVLGSTAIGLTGLAFGVGLKVGLDKQVPLAELLPSTIIPARHHRSRSAGGGLYLGIKRARDYHRWEQRTESSASHRARDSRSVDRSRCSPRWVVCRLGCFCTTNAAMCRTATLIAISSALPMATPIMFVIGAQRSKRAHGWLASPTLPPIPGENTSRLQIRPADRSDLQRPLPVAIRN